MELTTALDVTPTGARTRIDRVAGALVGGRCDECGATAWPSRSVCHRCGCPSMRETSFAAEGTLLTYTTVWVARPGLEPPYTIGQVKIPDGPVVFCHIRGLTDEGTVPLRVELVVDGDAAAVPPFWFEPKEDE